MATGKASGLKNTSHNLAPPTVATPLAKQTDNLIIRYRCSNYSERFCIDSEVTSVTVIYGHDMISIVHVVKIGDVVQIK